MDDVAQKMKTARRHVDARWNAEQVEANLAGLYRRQKRRRRARRVVSASLVVLIGVATAWLWLPTEEDSEAPVARALPAVLPETPPETERVLPLFDGSTVTLLTEETKIAVNEVGARLVAIELGSGKARFDVVTNPARRFVVEVGECRVEVLGTAFTLERGGAQLGVWVHQGKVRVFCPSGSAELTRGAHQWLDTELAPEPRDAARAPPPREARSRMGEPTAARAKDVGPTQWLLLAIEGAFNEAYALIQRDASQVIRDEPGELMLAADVARLSGHPEEATPHLTRVMEGYTDDPRAPLAAFTLGRVLLNDLGEPRQAARAFANARRLDPAGTLAQDALAREVESWFRAGDNARARDTALTYERLYPEGRRTIAVRRYGGLDY